VETQLKALNAAALLLKEAYEVIAAGVIDAGLAMVDYAAAELDAIEQNIREVAGLSV
jgi:hypothetical protein